MTDTEKAKRLIDVLKRIQRSVFLKPEDVIAKCAPGQLEMYYRGLVEKE